MSDIAIAGGRATWRGRLGAGIYLPPTAVRAALLLAIVVALVIWVFGEAFGMIPVGGATDPNSGPLLVLLALAYWPASAATVPGAAADKEGEAA